MDPGAVLDGRFRLVEKIGAGGMGVVFRALDEQAGRMVAVKVLEGRSKQEIERAHREAEVLARLSHPAIVRHVADGVLANGNFFLAMEWIDGITLADRISDEGLSLREALAVVRRVADALASAHRAQVVHRDLKPSNILLVHNDAAAAKLIDFGIARVSDSVLALTRTGAAIGTPGYMSPEQARGDRELTAAADVFGLGCVLYECMTSTPGFTGTAAAAVMAKILLVDPAPVELACPEAPPALRELVARMLAKKVEARLLDCGAVVAAIDAIGAIQDGPRRSSRRLTDDATQVARPTGTLHCIVSAARGNADDMLDPPTRAQTELLLTAVEPWQGQLEIIATGAVLVHFVGNAKDASHRAALTGLAMRRILPGWTIAISSVCEQVDEAAEQGTALLTQSALRAIFGAKTHEEIAVDPRTADLLPPDLKAQLMHE
jgi:serine/threonine protein kinase